MSDDTFVTAAELGHPKSAGTGVTAGELQHHYEDAVRRHLADRAASSTVDALMWSLRTRRTAALGETDTQHRITQLSEDQVVEVVDRLQKLKPHIAQPWSQQDIGELIIVRNRCLAKNRFEI